ncbi:MAG: hypothetical protein ABI277_00210 [Burkholderiaceae bacterium]
MEPMKPMKPMEPMKPQKPWWPGNLGSPSSSGSQNETRYAYFDQAHRLVVDTGGTITIYDTGSHRIQGFGQQQSGGSAMRFQSDSGTVDLGSLKQVS